VRLLSKSVKSARARTRVILSDMQVDRTRAQAQHKTLRSGSVRAARGRTQRVLAGAYAAEERQRPREETRSRSPSTARACAGQRPEYGHSPLRLSSSSLTSQPSACACAPAPVIFYAPRLPVPRAEYIARGSRRATRLGRGLYSVARYAHA